MYFTLERAIVDGVGGRGNRWRDVPWPRFYRTVEMDALVETDITKYAAPDVRKYD